MEITRQEILAWLNETDPARSESLFKAADELRKERVGDDVHLRGIIEISNVCARSCAYCGIRAERRELVRYRMQDTEIVEVAKKISDLEFGTVVLQSGEDPGIGRDWLAALIARIRNETGLAVTLSMGERSPDDLAAWRKAGAERYLLKFETSDAALFGRIHPPGPGGNRGRPEILEQLRSLDYEVGTGVMVGIPGQTLESLADDIMTFKRIDADMIGVGPFLPHPSTPLGAGADSGRAEASQVRGDIATTLKVMALTRLACPDANIPTTTALLTLSEKNRERGLNAGANVIMPNMTPRKYRVLYEIYPSKAKVDEQAERFPWTVRDYILKMGRTVGKGPGRRRK